MNINIVRKVDKNIGRVICFFLTLHRKICDLFRKNNGPYERPSKILFIKLVEQGSTVLAYPALTKAADLVGKDNVYFLVLKQYRPILDLLEVIPVSNVVEVNSKSFRKLVLSTIKALRRIRKENIDAVIDMEFFARISAIFSYLSGANKRVGLHQFNEEGPYRGNLFTHRLLYNPYVHTQILFASFVEALNHQPTPDDTPMTFEIPKITSNLPRFSPAKQEKKTLIEKIKKLNQGSLNKPVIILNPNVSDLIPIRRWPEESFVKLGKMILKEFPQATIVITGMPEEKEKADEIASQIGNTISLAGHTSLRELLTLDCIADVLVTNDSGPAHFSALTPIKAIILFGPETPILYGRKDVNAVNITPDVICSPCVNVYSQKNSPCTTGWCQTTIRVENVYNKVKDLCNSD